MGLLTRTVTDSVVQDRIIWQSASILMNYPDESTLANLPAIRAVLEEVSFEARSGLESVIAHLESAPLVELQEDYVTTFDERRRSNLFLTYFSHGDTRKRGTALLRFKQTYLAAGMQLDDAELPDHLCVVLEFAATDPAEGKQLLLDHRASLEMLRLALRDSESPWVGAVEAVCGTLPRLRGDELEAVRKLAAEGPPAEEVGLAPYGGPVFDALLNEKCGTASGPTSTDLPMPTRRSAR